jgi:hypothetical protein
MQTRSQFGSIDAERGAGRRTGQKMLPPDRRCPCREDRQGRSACVADKPRWCQSLRIQTLTDPKLFPRQIRKVIASLAEQYKAKEGEFEKFKGEYNIRPAARV